jgi:ABC-type glycerol-3-phosphate transport system substrate-binding protein
MRKILMILILMVMLIALAGCSSSPKAFIGVERDAVLAYAEPMADNELAALNAKDYDAFIKDYDETMLKATTPESFTNLVNLVSTRLGKYLSREVTAVSAVGEEYIFVIYSAKFEKEEGVTIRIIFQPGGDHLISGFWITSPKLRE